MILRELSLLGRTLCYNIAMKRINFIDTAKALALYLVVVGHTVSSTSPYFRFIFAFHMPVFFFFAGYCFKDRDIALGIGKFIAKKAKALLIPYAIFAVIGFAIMLVFDSWKPDLSAFDFAMKYVYYAQPPALGQTWFLIALLMSSIMFRLVIGFITTRDKTGVEAGTSGNIKLRPIPYILVMAAFAAAGALVCKVIHIPRFERLPWKIDTALTANVFMLAGYAFSKLGIMDKIKKPAMAVLTVILPVIIYFTAVRLNGYVNICDCIYDNVGLYYIGAFAGSIWMCILGKWLEQVNWLAWLGKNSMPIFGIHSFVLWAWVRVYCKIIHQDMVHLPDSLISLVIIPIIAYACSTLFVPVYNKVLKRL